jgi:hypothetical protein
LYRQPYDLFGSREFGLKRAGKAEEQALSS